MTKSNLVHFYTLEGGFMTDPVIEVSGSQGTHAGGRYSGGKNSGEHKRKGAASGRVDLVEISRDARSKAFGKKKKGLLEYLRDLFR